MSHLICVVLLLALWIATRADLKHSGKQIYNGPPPDGAVKPPPPALPPTE